MEPELSFTVTTKYVNGRLYLVLTDTSVYNEVIISNVFFFVSDAEGNIVAYPIDQETAEVEVLVPEYDIAYNIELVVNWNESQQTKEFSKNFRILTTHYFVEKKMVLENIFLEVMSSMINPNNPETIEVSTLMDELQLITLLGETAESKIQTDIVKAQFAITKANQLSDTYLCKYNK